MNNVGSFKVTCGRILVSDPCYENYCGRCSGIIEVPDGEWCAYVSREKGINTGLLIVHDDYDTGMFRHLNGAWPWKEQFRCCVDSGQLGFYDWLEFNHQYDYDKLCNLSSMLLEVGINQYCVVSSSGYGDGDYKCFTYETDGKVVAIKVIFDQEDEEEPEEWPS